MKQLCHVVGLSNGWNDASYDFANDVATSDLVSTIDRCHHFDEDSNILVILTFVYLMIAPNDYGRTSDHGKETSLDLTTCRTIGDMLEMLAHHIVNEKI